MIIKKVLSWAWTEIKREMCIRCSYQAVAMPRPEVSTMKRIVKSGNNAFGAFSQP